MVSYRVSSMSRRQEPTAEGWGSRMGGQVAMGAILLVLASEGIGRGGQRLRRSHGRLDQRPFVEDNLVGRSDRAHFLLASIANNDGDALTAIKELELSLQELKDEGERLRAEQLLRQLRAMNEQLAAPVVPTTNPSP